MSEKEVDEARATDRIIEVGTGEIVGILYEWQDGQKQPLWLNGEKIDVYVARIYELDCPNAD